MCMCVRVHVRVPVRIFMYCPIENWAQNPTPLCVCVCVCVRVCVYVCVWCKYVCASSHYPIENWAQNPTPQKKARYIGTHKRNWTQRNLNAKHSLTTLVCFFVVGAGGYSRIYFLEDNLTTRKMCTVWLHVMVSLHLRYTLSLHTHRHTWVQTKNGKKNVYCLITRDGTSVIKVHTLFTRTRRYSRVHTKRGN